MGQKKGFPLDHAGDNRSCILICSGRRPGPFMEQAIYLVIVLEQQWLFRSNGIVTKARAVAAKKRWLKLKPPVGAVHIPRVPKKNNFIVISLSVYLY